MQHFPGAEAPGTLTKKTMEKNYAEKTGPGTIAIHCDLIAAERIYEGICKVFAEYPPVCPSNWREEKRKLSKLKTDIEALLPAETQTQNDTSWEK